MKNDIFQIKILMKRVAFIVLLSSLMSGLIKKQLDFSCLFQYSICCYMIHFVVSGKPH